MREKNNLQEILLTKLRRERQPVTVFLMNGYQMQGTVSAFDAFTVVLVSYTHLDVYKRQMIN